MGRARYCGLGTLGRINIVNACGHALSIRAAAVPISTTHHRTHALDDAAGAVGDGNVRVLHQVGDLDHTRVVGLHGIGKCIDVVKVECGSSAFSNILGKAVVGENVYTVMLRITLNGIDNITRDVTVACGEVVKHLGAIG